jgi:hypothetical protein
VAGGVLTAKQAPHWPGTAPALGLRAGNVPLTIPSQAIHEIWNARRTMPHKSRSLPVAALFIGGAAGLLYFDPDKGSRQDSDCNAPSTVRRSIDDKYPMDEESEHRLQIYLMRIAVRDRVVRNLLAGRLTLLQAATQFRDMEKDLPVTWGPPIEATGPGEGERLCRSVMRWVHNWIAENLPAEAASVAARLEAELGQLRGPDGTVRLPD